MSRQLITAVRRLPEPPHRAEPALRQDRVAELVQEDDHRKHQDVLEPIDIQRLFRAVEETTREASSSPSQWPSDPSMDIPPTGFDADPPPDPVALGGGFEYFL